eukprot:scaffold51559_cov31-Tisochrysis_lutea.AAC.4
MTQRFLLWASSRRNFMIAAAAAESRPDVGSSRMSTLGSLTRTIASANLRFCPPDRPLKSALPALVCCAEVRPVASSSASTAASRCGPAATSGRYSEKACSICWRATKEDADGQDDAYILSVQVFRRKRCVIHANRVEDLRARRTKARDGFNVFAVEGNIGRERTGAAGILAKGVGASTRPRVRRRVFHDSPHEGL